MTKETLSVIIKAASKICGSEKGKGILFGKFTDGTSRDLSSAIMGEYLSPKSNKKYSKCNSKCKRKKKKLKNKSQLDEFFGGDD